MTSRGAGDTARLPDVVYIVRPGDDNEELRYSLRSVAENVPHRKVWVIGHCPPWVRGVETLELEPLPGRFDNQHQSLSAVVAEDHLADEFYLWNDDIYATRRFDGILPTHHLGPLRDYVATLEAIGKTAQSGWLLGMREMLGLLERWGRPDPLCYEGHMPLRFRKTDMARFVRHRTEHFLPAQFYAATDLDPGTRWIDAQPGILGHPLDDPDPPFMASSDSWFQSSRLGSYIRARFAKPCVYESGGRP